jgi:hypothetical protein
MMLRHALATDLCEIRLVDGLSISDVYWNYHFLRLSLFIACLLGSFPCYHIRYISESVLQADPVTSVCGGFT